MSFDVVLFDLGGVLIELPPMSSMMSGSPFIEQEIRQRWSRSDAVRDFESGRTRPHEFARAMVEEFRIDAAPEAFLERFTAWPSGPIPGAIELVRSLATSHRVACLSNTNVLHWTRFDRELDLPQAFHRTFASHHVGMMKPDARIYEHVIAELAVEPRRIVFFDDNQANVDAATESGMTALLARGPEAVSRHLEALRRE